MAEPLVAATPVPPVPLTARASLNGIAFALDLGVKTGVSLVLTPLLVDRLGAGLFGVWEMLGRLAGYLAAIGGRPAEALRLVVANRQAAPAEDQDRKSVVEGKRVDLGGRRIIKKKKKNIE